jgi:hypothetical protein
MGRPSYEADEFTAASAFARLGPQAKERLIVEDPDHPLPEDMTADGTTTIVVDDPERVELETSSEGPSYLFLADTFDPGWSATVDGKPAPIRPAYVAFRAVYLPAGAHRVAFTYVPAGFRPGLVATAAGLAVVLVLLAWPRRVAELAPPHTMLAWPRRWPLIALVVIALIIAGSAVRIGPGGIGVHSRAAQMFHTFTWGAGIEAISETRDAVGR